MKTHQNRKMNERTKNTYDKWRYIKILYFLDDKGDKYFKRYVYF